MTHMKCIETGTSSTKNMFTSWKLHGKKRYVRWDVDAKTGLEPN